MENYIMVCESDNSVHIVVDVITGKYYRVDIRRDVHEQLLEKYNILFQENYPMLMREYPEIKAWTMIMLNYFKDDKAYDHWI